VPYPAGGGSDNGARVLAAHLEKELGTSVVVVNKGGAGSQVGVTATALAKPDGYTIGYPNWPTIITMYLDPERKTSFNRKSFEPVALHLNDHTVVAVRTNSPYKSLKELVDAARKNPEKIRTSNTGILSPDHLAILQLQKIADVSFAIVNFDGGAPALTAVLGGHTDVAFGGLSPLLPQIRAGNLRVLATMDKEESRFLPGVKTAEAQGYPVRVSLNRGFIAPAGTPKPILSILSEAIMRAMETDAHKKRIEEFGQTQRYMNPQQFGAFWDEMESEIKPLMGLALQK
jgi:tripartite-type tricarboxylate transporter receptor subunit TctC